MSPCELLIRSARLSDGSLVDISISNGLITDIQPSSTVNVKSTEVVDASGYILLPSFCEPHAHLDKAFLADRVHNPVGDLMGAINGLAAVRSTITHADIVERALRAVVLMSQNGVTSIRTHADTTRENQLSSIHALLEVKEKCSHFMDIQIAMLMEWPLTGNEGGAQRSLAREAVAAGVDVVGGCPHLDADPKGAVEFLLELAMDSELPLDLHADENLRTDSIDLEHLADIVIADKINHQMAASHCVSLSIREEHDIHRIADKVSQANIGVIALPQTNLFLQSRGQISMSPRAITPINALRNAGVTVAAGADNLQDPFNLIGRADPLEIASLLVTASHLSTGKAIESVTSDAHQIVSGVSNNLVIGAGANLVGVRATNVREAIAMGPPDRFVVYGGVVLSDQKRNRK